MANTALIQTKKRFEDALANHKKSIESVLPKGMDSARFCRMAINAVMKDSKLLECSPQSFLMAVINCAETGLEPTLGQAAFVPYKGQVKFIPMYGGLINLIYNTGFVTAVNANVVREGDKFEYELGTNGFIKFKEKPNNDAELTYAYAIANMKGGGQVFVVLHKRDVLKRQAVSPSAKSEHSPWQKWTEEQWKKSAIKALVKLLPKSIELSRAIELDNQAEMNRQSKSRIQKPPEYVDFEELPPDYPVGDFDENAPMPWETTEKEQNA